jgi:type I restriction enzyme R subunit
MKNHTLMQTIARANRVYAGKTNGLIVDYIGVFRNLQKALAVYATSINGDVVIKSKDQLVEELEEAIHLVNNFCLEQNIDLTILKDFSELKKIDAVDIVVNTILIREEIKNKFLSLADKAIRYFGAILPDKRANKYFENIKLFRVLADRIRILTKKEVDISEISDKIEKILDESIESDGYNIKTSSKITDLSKIDFEVLKEKLDKANKYLEAEKLKAFLETEIDKMIRLNATRKDLLEKLQKLVEEYNLGAKNIEEYLEELINLTKDTSEELNRAFKEGLSEEELAIVDLVRKPNLSEKEIKKIKSFAKIILEKLKDNQLVLD